MVDLIKKNIKSLRESLFSSVGSALLTIATTYLVINFFRGMLGFALTSDKDWLAVLNNMQLYMVQAYPEEDFIRVWLSVGLTFVLAGLSIGIWRSDDRVKSSQVFNSFFKGGLGYCSLQLLLQQMQALWEMMDQLLLKKSSIWIQG